MGNYGRVSNEVERDRSNLSGMCPVQYVGYVTGPYRTGTPPYTPLGYEFPLKPCRLFITRLESMPVENFSRPNSPA